MKNHKRTRALRKTGRLAKATREMRIRRLVSSGRIKSGDEVPLGAIPADLDKQKHGAGISVFFEDFFNLIPELFCCRSVSALAWLRDGSCSGADQGWHRSFGFRILFPGL